METENPSDAAAIIEAVHLLKKPDVFELSRKPEQIVVLAVPAGKTLVGVKRFIDEYAERPDRIKGTARLTTLKSFVEHTNRFKDLESVVFADVTAAAPRLLAVLDYNEAAPEPEPNQISIASPRFGEHRAEYRFPVSKEWEAWTNASKKGLSQAEFAEFLEDRLLDVMDPDLVVDGEQAVGSTARRMASALGIVLAGPQRLLELSRGLSIKAAHLVTGHVNVSSGESQISFTEEHKTEKGEQLKIPGGFVIGIPVFRDGVLYQLPVRLRYRVANQAVTWFVGLQRADLAFDDAVKATAETAQKSTNLPLFFGTPEA